MNTNEYAHDMIMFAVFDNKPVVHFIEPIHYAKIVWIYLPDKHPKI